MILKVVYIVLSVQLSPLVVISSSAARAALGSSISSLRLRGGHDVVRDLLLRGGEDLHQTRRDLEIGLWTEK